MNINVGQADRLLRIFIGSALIVWAAFFSGPVWAYIGVLPLITGFFRWCPAYSLFGFKTGK